ncbi:MAG: BrnA antitoxin family protein [Deltaproteobacteria bacterium]|nr:BrnA antitoxin family protein [Deltaproteobacteria bacterium]MBW1962292.1 BrnA antitoxin family protein [Deltaproteobacteria bacterium]MBW1994028.1 BrnA antitoxin family protein [Deltaproteobacteria bacterium]MBW2154352.1 BrnA antitoxin family protein [Deltaproteobacteria bacterium]
MSKKYTSRDSQTDWQRLNAMRDKDIDMSDIPEITKKQLSQAKLRIGGKPLARGKIRVNIFLDAEVVAYFKAKAGGRGYQTLINEALKDNIRQHDIETILRRVIREELHTAD